MLGPDETLWRFVRAFGKALRLLALPVAQFLALRVLLKQGFHLQFGWQNFTDWDLIFPLPLAVALSLFVLERTEPIRLRWNFTWLSINGVVASAFVLLNARWESLAAKLSFLTALTWTLLGCATVGSAFAVRVCFRDVLRNQNRWVLFSGLSIATAGIYSQVLLKHLWPLLAQWAAGGTCAVLGWGLGDVTCFATELQGYRVIIRNEMLGITVGRGCGGLDGFLLFLNVCLVIGMVAPTWFTKRQWLAVTLFGLPVMYALNVLRIALFFAFGIAAQGVLGATASVDLMLAFFHSHAGWVLLLFGILSYFSLCDKILHFNLPKRRSMVPAWRTGERSS